MKSKHKRWLIVAVIAGALLLWVGIDLFGPRRADIRRFDPNEVARLETDLQASWQSLWKAIQP